MENAIVRGHYTNSRAKQGRRVLGARVSVHEMSLGLINALIGRVKSDVWSRDVARWVRCGLSVAGPFVCRCLNSLTMLPFPHPAHRTVGPASVKTEESLCR
jgi:hypothetical protein